MRSVQAGPFPFVAALVPCALVACSGIASPPLYPTTSSALASSSRAELQVTRATPVPTPTPTPSPPPASYLAITVNTPRLTTRYGANSFPCAVQITTSDPNTTAPYSDLLAYTTDPPGGFPMSNVAWSVPDLSSDPTPLYTHGLPGQLVWNSLRPNETQSHCMTLAVQVAKAIAAGSYSGSITYIVAAGGSFGLRGTADTQTVTFQIVVTGS